MRRSIFWLLDHYPETGETGETIASAHAFAIEQAVLADQLGFASLWLAEHHFCTLGTIPNPAILLAAIAQRTQTIRLGPAVAVLPLRDPIQVAEDYALVDALSGGRLNMGVGSGSQSAEYAPFAVDFERRRELFADSLAAIRSRWSAAADGDRGPSSINVAPVQTPSVPIYIATMSEDTAYRIGRAGDSMLTLLTPPADGLDGLTARVRAHARGLDHAGLAPTAAQAVVIVFAHLAPTEEEAKATAAPALARLMPNLTGTTLTDPKAFYEHMRSRDAGIFGTPDQADQQLQRFADLGVRHLAFVTRFGGMPRDAATRSLRLLAPTEA